MLAPCPPDRVRAPPSAATPHASRRTTDRRRGSRSASGCSPVAAAAPHAWPAHLAVSEVVEDLPSPALLRPGAEALDRPVGLPAAILRGLDRHVSLPRAAPAGEPHEQAFGAPRSKLHGSCALGDRQQHPVALAELPMPDRDNPVLGAVAQACDVALHVLHARLTLVDEPDQPPEVHPRGEQQRPRRRAVAAPPPRLLVVGLEARR